MTATAIDPVVRALVRGDALPADLPKASLREIAGHRLGPLLAASLRAQDRAIAKPIHELLAKADLQAQVRHAHRAAALASLVELGSQLGLQLFVFKGQWNGTKLYPQPHVRPGADIDLSHAHWSPPQRRAFLAGLGVADARIDAIDRLDSSGRPLHEITVPLAEFEINVDLHANPFGLIGQSRVDLTEAASESATIPGAGRVLGPSPELGLLIALLNLTRKGGSYLIGAADAARFIDTAGDTFDWDVFAALATGDRLTNVTQQALWALFDDLRWYPRCGFARPRRRAHWAAQLGVPKPPWRVSTLVHLRRGRQLRPQHFVDVARWYVPSPAALHARVGDQAPTTAGRFVLGARNTIESRRATAETRRRPDSAP